MRVLICDDNVQIVELIEIYVKTMGDVKIDKVYDCGGLYDKLVNNEYNIVLTDVLMPSGGLGVSNGLDTVNRVRKENKLKVDRLVFVTGHASDNDLSDEEVIYKPFGSNEIMAVLNRSIIKNIL